MCIYIYMFMSKCMPPLGYARVNPSPTPALGRNSGGRGEFISIYRVICMHVCVCVCVCVCVWCVVLCCVVLCCVVLCCAYVCVVCVCLIACMPTHPPTVSLSVSHRHCTHVLRHSCRGMRLGVCHCEPSFFWRWIRERCNTLGTHGNIDKCHGCE